MFCLLEFITCCLHRSTCRLPGRPLAKPVGKPHTWAFLVAVPLMTVTDGLQPLPTFSGELGGGGREAGVHLENAGEQQEALKHLSPLRKPAGLGPGFVAVFLFSCICYMPAFS